MCRGGYFYCILLLLNFSFAFSMDGPVGFDLTVKNLVELNVAVRSQHLHHRLKDFVFTQGCSKKLTMICEPISLSQEQLKSVLNLINNLCVFCKKENISGNVLILTLIYFKNVLKQLNGLNLNTPQEKIEFIVNNLVGCFILAYKYYEEYLIGIGDVVPLCKMNTLVSFGRDDAEIKAHLLEAEKTAFKYLDFNAWVSGEEFEAFSDEISKLSLDNSAWTKIRALDGLTFIKCFVDEVGLILFVRGVKLKNQEYLQKFVSKFIAAYPDSNSVFDILILSLTCLNCVGRLVIDSVVDFTDDILLFVLFGCFMLSDTSEGVDWDVLFKEIFPEHLRAVKASNLYKRIADFAASGSLDFEYLERLCDKILME